MRGDYEQSIKYSDIVISKGKACAMNYLNRAVCDEKRGEDCEAINDLGKLIDALTNSPSQFGSCHDTSKGGVYLHVPMALSADGGASLADTRSYLGLSENGIVQ